MIPSVTPLYNPPDVFTPLVASASSVFSQSKFIFLLPYLPYVIFTISLSLFGLAGYTFYRSLRRYITSPKVILELKPPHKTQQSAFSTEQLFTAFHSLGLQTTWWQCFLGRKKLYALELVATREQGIRYCVRVYKDDADVIKRSLRAYISGITIKETQEYLPKSYNDIHGIWNVISLKLSNHYVLPLQKQSALSEHDPIAYITNHMTKLEPQEIVVYQLIVTPLIKDLHGKILKEIRDIDTHLYNGFDISHKIYKNNRPFPLNIIFGIIKFFLAIFVLFITFPLLALEVFARDKSDHSPLNFPIWLYSPPRLKRYHELSPSQQFVHNQVREKIGQELFESSIRVFLMLKTDKSIDARQSGIKTSFSPFNNSDYQGISSQRKFPFIHKIPLYWKYSYFIFKNRLLSFKGKNNSILTVSELSSLFHFPYFGTTETEDLVNTKSEVLPAPLSLKQADKKLDIIFAKNTYGEKETLVGLTMEERRRHVYILGATGTGKTTLLTSMISQDIQNGKGLAIIDPHGDLAEKIAGIIPKKRVADTIYFDPSDMEYPISINLLEPQKGLTGKKLAKEKDLIASSLISVFTKIYPPRTMGHRMEYILRNAILTALETENPTLFTIQKLLSDHDYRKTVVKTLTDEVLLLFWNKEFKKYGTHQEAEVISPITNKLGRFLTSPLSRDILNSPTSTIDFQNIMDNGKIFICNLSKGKIGEDISAFFGAIITAKFQLTAYKRADTPEQKRKDFYLYIDEFQNFASSSFAQVMSEARKYHLNVILAHQTISQVEDKDLTKIIVANSGTIISFRTGSSFDEDFILPQFSPKVRIGNIASLPSYSFYIKINAVDPQDSFTAETLPVTTSWNKKTLDMVTQNTRKNFTIQEHGSNKETPKIPKKPAKNARKNSDEVSGNMEE